jgi:hypothetical protein
MHTQQNKLILAVDIRWQLANCFCIKVFIGLRFSNKKNQYQFQNHISKILGAMVTWHLLFVQPSINPFMPIMYSTTSKSVTQSTLCVSTAQGIFLPPHMPTITETLLLQQDKLLGCTKTGLVYCAIKITKSMLSTPCDSKLYKMNSTGYIRNCVFEVGQY